ncbi:MAG: glycosyltransferase [Elusimicrobia bacterium]|nr:glycosyltransferase [Elusimicrobiota bacterium]
MRIGVFTDHFYPELGGIQDSVAELARELGRRGHEVDVWAPRASRADFALAGLPLGESDLGPRVRVRRVPAVGFPSSSLQSRLASPFFRLHAAAYDVVHVHSFLGIGRRGLNAAKRLGVPVVGTNHWAVVEFADYVPKSLCGLFRAGSLAYVSSFYGRCDHVTAPSRLVLDEMAARGLSAPRSTVSNPIDTDVFRPPRAGERESARRNLGLSGRVVACIGRIAPEKRTDVVLRAFARLAIGLPDAQLAFAGHGSFEPRMRALTRELGVADKVRFLGTLTKPLLASFLRAADLYAIASVSETQSMSLLQSFASGLPAVGVRWRAIPDYLDDDKGRLFERDDERAMAARMAELLGAGPLRRRLGAQARTFAERFSVSAVADSWEAIYRGVRRR